jgi:hypothetical protein
MTTLTEALHPGAFIISEAPHMHCRDSISIPAAQTVLAGQVLGRRVLAGDLAAATSSVVADSGNTGNGVFTLDGAAPVGQGAKDGNYRVVNELVAANSGEFVVYDPAGIEIGRVAVGATFNNQIKFVIADGSADFAIGDAFTVTVGIADSQYEYLPLNLAAADGTQNIAGIAVAGIVTTSASAFIAGLVRGPADVRASNLSWPAGITAAQQAEGLRALERLGIVPR